MFEQAIVPVFVGFCRCDTLHSLLRIEKTQCRGEISPADLKQLNGLTAGECSSS